ncbi:MAG: protein-export chaperone SecB [Paludibacteraceae bacterium]|nr:protein-export chaperone SecB [Paludibacteraceae bacterium]
MEKASFALKHYFFERAELNLENVQDSESLSLNFTPNGEYLQKDGLFFLSFVFSAKRETDKKPVITVLCKGVFQFKSPLMFEEIPEHFFSNTIAILFPYIRAFVSTLTVQANVAPIMLPTMNLTSLSPLLKTRTIVKK